MGILSTTLRIIVRTADIRNGWHAKKDLRGAAMRKMVIIKKDVTMITIRSEKAEF